MKNLWSIVNSVISSKTYVLGDVRKEEFWLVDCGDTQRVLEKLSIISDGKYRIKGVLLTHAHYDHIYGLPNLVKTFSNTKVYTNLYGKQALADERLNLSKYHRDPIRFKSDNVIICDEGAEIELFDDLTATVFSTPGHNPSCLTFMVDDYLFTGDSYIPGDEVVTKLPGGNKEETERSLVMIKKLSQGKIICPGHVEGVKSSLFGLL
jgi:glyoxylase-like metal-dependent hydrolase (beta-lactamase superfamily II)